MGRYLKTLVFLPWLVLSFFPGNGQDKQNKKLDLRLGVGIFSHPYMEESKDNGQPAFDIPILTDLPVRGSGILNMSASLDINQKLQAGLSFAFQKLSVDSRTYDFEYRVSHITIMPLLNYKFRQNKMNYLYAGACVGPSFRHLSSPYGTGNATKLAYQLTALGFRNESKYSAAMELGYGYKGIVVIQFSAKM